MLAGRIKAGEGAGMMMLRWAGAALLVGAAGACLGGTADGVMRTTNSVDIQVCVNSAFLTPQRDAFQAALCGYLTGSVLNSNGLYLDRQFTTGAGSLCYLYVFQAPSPKYAQLTLGRLTEQASITVPLSGADIACSVSAAQWSGDNLSYLGAPFPLLWTVNDMLLWGGCLLSVLFLCMSGLCCFALLRLRAARQLQLPHAAKMLKLPGAKA